MRRSGTTILYDALLEDPELRCFYEPLREEKKTVGGGSGARETDAFAETRELRAALQRERFPELPLEEFNWGGPRTPALEVEPGLPEHCRELLRHLLGLAPAVAIKETRFYDKLAELAELDPDAALAHVVRDPRAVTASIILGRGRRREKHFPTVGRFFADAKKRRLWSSYEISERLLARPGAPQLEDPTSVDRVLLVWKHTFESTFGDGREHFGDRYRLLRNEDLRADPAAALEPLYAAMGRSLPVEVETWAHEKVRPPEEAYAATDRRWLEAFRRLEMEEAVASAGYPQLLEEARYQRPSRLRGLGRLWR